MTSEGDIKVWDFANGTAILKFEDKIDVGKFKNLKFLGENNLYIQFNDGIHRINIY